MGFSSFPFVMQILDDFKDEKNCLILKAEAESET